MPAVTNGHQFNLKNQRFLQALRDRLEKGGSNRVWRIFQPVTIKVKHLIARTAGKYDLSAGCKLKLAACLLATSVIDMLGGGGEKNGMERLERITVDVARMMSRICSVPQIAEEDMFLMCLMFLTSS